MTVGDVKCPACDAPIVDVASSYEFHRSDSTLQAQVLNATCEGGHALCVKWSAERFGVEVRQPTEVR